MLDIRQIIAKVLTYLPQANVSLIERAFRYAERRHQGQKRRSGEPYIVHPLGVASILTQMRMDEECIAAGLLHDCVEDTDAEMSEIRGRFGVYVAQLVDSLTKISHYRYNDRQEKQAENFRKLMVGATKDPRVILIKLADRLDNMRTLGSMPEEKRIRIATETMDIYVPLANRLGMQWLRAELEDLSFQHLNPELFARIAQEVQKAEKPRKKFMAEVEARLVQKLEEASISARVTSRAKNIFGIYKKMAGHGKPVSQVYDIIGLRIVTQTLDDCYRSLGLVHTLFMPVPSRIKDYIAMPKNNGYRSLHTTVVVRDKGAPRHVEIQIRTEDMHREAEEGVAAHWVYKEGRAMPPEEVKAYAWLRDVVQIHKDLATSIEFYESVRRDILADQVWILTPKGDIKLLPEGATPVDFAYGIHSEIGDHCVGAKVNGKMVPLDTKLRSADVVEILTSKHQRPNKEWLSFVVTERARAKIRRYLREQNRARALETGQKKLEAELRRHKLSLARLRKQGELSRVARQLKSEDERQLLINIGFGKIPIKKVIRKLVPEEELREQEAAAKRKTKQGLLKRLLQRSPAILVDGHSDIYYRLARCCSPLPGDPIAGFSSRSRGVAVHRTHCSQIRTIPDDRRVPVRWGSEAAKNTYQARILVISENRPGLLAKMSEAIANAGVNILQAKCIVEGPDQARNEFVLEVHSADQLGKVMRALEKIKGVYKVLRL